MKLSKRNNLISDGVAIIIQREGTDGIDNRDKHIRLKHHSSRYKEPHSEPINIIGG